MDVMTGKQIKTATERKSGVSKERHK